MPLPARKSVDISEAAQAAWSGRYPEAMVEHLSPGYLMSDCSSRSRPPSAAATQAIKAPISIDRPVPSAVAEVALRAAYNLIRLRLVVFERAASEDRFLATVPQAYF
jgi:hypothetical protein